MGALRLWLTCLMLFAAGTGHLAGQPMIGNAREQSAADTPQTPTLRVSSRLVLVNVVVHDKAGNPVRDLTARDFTVLDEGRPQTIQEFTAVSAPPTATSSMPALPINIFTNRIEQRTGETTTAAVILLDALNTTFSDTAYVRGQVVKFLQQLQPTDHVALYGLGRQVYVLHEFTQDQASLLRALHDYQPGTGLDVGVFPDLQSPTGFSGPNYNTMFSDVDELERTFKTAQRAEATAAALEQIANHLKGFPGRKNLIWVSSGFPTFVGLDAQSPGLVQGYDPQSHYGDVIQAIQALNESSVAVYAIDAQGLTTSSDFSGASSEPGSPFELNSTDASSANISTMGMIASRTGGRLFYDTNDIKGALRSAIDDSEVYYTLGYYPDHGKWNGSFREIKVKTDRPGVQVRARSGYFAMGDERPNEKQHNDTVKATSVMPLDATGIAVTLQATPKPGTKVLTIAMLVDPSTVRFDVKDGKHNGSLDFIFVQLDKTGTVLNFEAQTTSLNLHPESYTKVMQKGLFTEKDLTLDSKAVEVRVIVRDAGSDAIGSVSVPLGRLIRPAGGQ
jgi:VWFA-related protein